MPVGRAYGENRLPSTDVRRDRDAVRSGDEFTPAGYEIGMTGPDLERFVLAQDDRETFAQALSELRAGRKTSHWMWFVFPQIAGLGRSAVARHYAVSDLEEARAYLAHPVLGPRLHECCEALLAGESTSAEHVLGSVDAMKLRSSMTLFGRAAPEDTVFGDVLERFFAGRPDPATDELLA
jgi:uncharacterized protein (DUF1810 family)